jgi:hypothetical protein
MFSPAEGDLIVQATSRVHRDGIKQAKQAGKSIDRIVQRYIRNNRAFLVLF